MQQLPTKLTRDAIIEALLEIRFNVASALPEVMLGYFTGHASWKHFAPSRLPAAYIPELVRDAQEELRYQPTLELRAPEGGRALKLGTHVLSFHNLAPYMGWTEFQPALAEVVDALYDAGSGVAIQRLGLRYINAFNRKDHSINGIGDLNVEIDIGGNGLADHVNLNFSVDRGDHHRCVVRLATPDFVEGVPAGATVIADVDIFTPRKPPGDNKDDVKRWVAEAHDIEKKAFFALLKDETIAALTEE